MNYKLLFPTFRNRYLFIKNNLEQYGKQKFSNGLNLGTGEGDYDYLISLFCDSLIGCDINERDIAFAKQLNESVANLTYQVDNALDLSFADNSFDLLISVEVLEHVGKPDIMVKEISRVLKPNGLAMLTFPRFNFPVIYDPINKWFRKGEQRFFGQGAYAFGHEYLVKADAFEQWCAINGLEILESANLSGGLVGLLEAYWTGIAQRAFKDNSTNLEDANTKKFMFKVILAHFLISENTFSPPYSLSVPITVLRSYWE